MNTVDLRRWANRLGAVAILLFGAGLAYALMVAPVLGAITQREATLTSLEGELATYQALAAQHGAWEALREEARQGVASAGLLLANGDPAVAQATSLARASDLAAASGLTILSTESRPLERREGLIRLPVVIRVEGSDQAMAHFLASIAESQPLIVVDQMTLRVTGNAPLPGGETRLQGQVTLVSLSRDKP